MLYTYFIAFSDQVGTQDQVKRFLNARPEVADWYYCMPNSIFVVTDVSASELKDVLLEFTGKRGRFLILDTDTDRNGWLPQEAWSLMRRTESPRHTGRS